MKKFKSFLYWIGLLVSYLFGFTVFGIIIAMLLKLPDRMLSGFVAWAVMICFLLFGAEDDTRETIMKLITKGK